MRPFGQKDLFFRGEILSCPVQTGSFLLLSHALPLKCCTLFISRHSVSRTEQRQEKNASMQLLDASKFLTMPIAPSARRASRVHYWWASVKSKLPKMLCFVFDHKADTPQDSTQECSRTKCWRGSMPKSSASYGVLYVQYTITINVHVLCHAVGRDWLVFPGQS